MASKWTLFAGVTLALGALQGGTAVAQENCGDEARATPLRPPQLLTPSDVKSAEEYAYAQNRRLVFREAADAYQDLATISDTRLINADQRFESALFNAVNLSNQDRSAEAAQRLENLARDPEGVVRSDPFRAAQLSFFTGLVAAQQGQYQKALQSLGELDTRLSGLGLSSDRVKDAILHPNGDVDITQVGAMRVSRSGGDARASRTYGSILGQRAMTPVEKTAILKTHSHYLRSVIHQKLSAEAADAATKQREAQLADVEISRASEAASVFGVQYAPWLRAKVAARAALLRLQAGDNDGARRVAEGALAIYTSYGNGGPLEAELRRALASVHLKEGNRAEALNQERAAFCVRAAGADLAPISTEEVLPLLDLLLTGNASTDDSATTGEFFRVAASAMEGDTARIVSQSAHLMSQRAEQQPEIREAILAEIELARLKERLAGLLTDGKGAADQDVRLTRSKIAETQAKLQQIYSQGVPENLSSASASERARAANFLPGQAAMADAANADLAGLQALLQPGEVYVRFVVTSDAAYGIAVDRTRARAYRVADPAGLQTRLQTIQEAVFAALRTGAGDRMVDVLDESAGAYNDLFGPAGDLVSGARNLIIDATGAAANIPFAMLVARPMSASEVAGVRQRAARNGGRDFTGVPWLAREKSISMVASAVSFKSQREDAAGSSAPNPILAFASPPIANEAMRPQLAADVTRLMQQRPRYAAAACADELNEIYSYEGLPGAYESAVSASRLLAGADASMYRIVSGSDYSDANIRNFASYSQRTGKSGDLDDYRVIYFGSHGQDPGTNECVQEALLVTSTPSAADAARRSGTDDSLGDGMLDTSEIQRLSLNADLVVLAACDTVGMRRIKQGAELTPAEAARLTRLTGLSGGGVIGNFASSFFVAGARSVLATYWAVENDATNRFMNAFFQNAGQGAAKAEALQGAQRRLMDDPEFSNPVFWAPFVFIGDGSKSLKVAPQRPS
jgi:hypothetical protein